MSEIKTYFFREVCVNCGAVLKESAFQRVCELTPYHCGNMGTRTVSVEKTHYDDNTEAERLQK